MKHTPKKLYPRCSEYKLPINYTNSAHTVSLAEMKKLYKRKGPKFTKRFAKLFGVQTCNEYGLYAWDVEAVLERMESGKLTGTQLDWD